MLGSLSYHASTLRCGPLDRADGAWQGPPSAAKGARSDRGPSLNDIIDALPGQWVDAAAQLVLRRVAAQVAIAERVEARLRDLAMRDDDPEALEAEQMLARHASRDLEVHHPWAVGLESNPAEPVHGGARRSNPVDRACSGPFRPWEIVAKRSDGQVP